MHLPAKVGDRFGRSEESRVSLDLIKKMSQRKTADKQSRKYILTRRYVDLLCCCSRGFIEVCDCFFFFLEGALESSSHGIKGWQSKEDGYTFGKFEKVSYLPVK